MRAWLYSTSSAAQRAIDAIDTARGPTETYRYAGGGPTWEAPAKTWAHPVRLRDGRWVVIASERLRGVEGHSLPAHARVPMLSAAVDVADEDRADTEGAE